MEFLKLVLLLGLAATASAAVCTNSITVDGGRGRFWACLEIGSGCITAYVSYNGIATDPSITFCEGQNSDGSKCHTATSSNICSDIFLSTILKIPTPDLAGTLLEFRAGFRSSPPKVCFSGLKDECSSGSSTPTTEEPTPEPNPSGIPPLSEEDRRAVVDRHNYLRRNVNPTAGNMKKMKYDETLERFARGYLDQLSTCPLQHNPNNDDYGENVYVRTAWGAVSNEVDYEHIVQLWYDEVSYYNYVFNTCSPPEGESCGHFTQIVWDDTERVGCATKICRDGGITRTLVVCNYDPPGNVIPYGSSKPRRPYTSGYPCTRCPSGYTSCQNSLCVKSSGVELASEQLSDEMLKILLGYADKQKAGVQEWEMGSKDEEKHGEFAVGTDSDGGGGDDTRFKVTHKEVKEGNSWVDQVI